MEEEITKAVPAQVSRASRPPAGLTPSEIVRRLDFYIIGQQKAKRLVAVALRNRERRIKLPDDIRDEVAPKNILMIGPTGVGKTEIARRLARLCGAPFLKVEATKYTEVGYVGRDVESMVRDLMAVGYNMVKSEMQETLKERCAVIVEEQLLDLLLPGSATKKPDRSRRLSDTPNPDTLKAADASANMQKTREKFRAWLRSGALEDREVEVTIRYRPPVTLGIMGPGGDALEEGISGLQDMLGSFNKRRRRTVTVKEARRILMDEALDNATDTDKVSDEARRRVEQSGIIFIDEIDKIATHGGEGDRASVSREGVQRDILPIVEGSDVNTKWGVVNTTHILFIGAGAFSVTSPSDLIPELQGRFPLRCELDALKRGEFKRILTEPKNALIKQYQALLETEGVTLRFDDEAIDRMSEIAEEVNSHSENIGARRLHTIMETVLEDLSFDADQHAGETVTITKSYVDEKLRDIMQNQDLERYIL